MGCLSDFASSAWMNDVGPGNPVARVSVEWAETGRATHLALAIRELRAVVVQGVFMSCDLSKRFRFMRSSYRG